MAAVVETTLSSTSSAHAASIATDGTLYLQRAGARLGAANGCYCVQDQGREIARLHAHEVRSIVLIGRIDATAGALDLAFTNRVPIAHLTAAGRLRGLLAPAGDASSDIPHAARAAQWRAHLAGAADPTATAIARSIVQAKIDNARSLVLRTARRRAQAGGHDAARPLQTAAALLERIRARTHAAADASALMGHEGSAARAAFRAFPGLLAPRVRADFPFIRRTRRPPRDPFNALLSFTYGLLAALCAGAVHASGLEPTVGFLHTPHRGRPSLALDLMEELRAPLAERLVLALVNLGQITPAHFTSEPPGGATGGTEEGRGDAGDLEEDAQPPATARPQGPPVWLSEEGRVIVLRAWRARLAETIQHPGCAQPVPWRLVPHLQARHLASLLARGEGAHYRPFRPRL